MKKQKSLTAKNILFALTLTVLVAIPTAMARAQSSEDVQLNRTEAQSAAQGGLLDVLEQIKQAQAQKLEGSWNVIVTPAVPPGVPAPPSFIGHATFSRGGAAFGSDRTRPASKQHGAWTHLGGNDFAWTTIEDLFDVMGNFAGTVKVRVRGSFTGEDTFVGVSNGEFRDAVGNITQSRCGTVRGERIKVEPLPTQCQTITPPQ